MLIGCASPSKQASTACASAGAGPIKERVLIFGDSWAAKGQELPAFPIALAKRRNHAVRVCSIGYIGYNSRKQIGALDRDWTRERLEALLGGDPAYVVLLTGVNDLIQHRGADAYAADVTALSERKQWSGAQIATVALPRVNMSPPMGLASASKRFLQRWWNDRGEYDPVDAYRDRLKSSVHKVKIIPYDSAFPSYRHNSHIYTHDGLHLISKYYRIYGGYIAEQID